MNFPFIPENERKKKLKVSIGDVVFAINSNGSTTIKRMAKLLRKLAKEKFLNDENLKWIQIQMLKLNAIFPISAECAHFGLKSPISECTTFSKIQFELKTLLHAMRHKTHTK